MKLNIAIILLTGLVTGVVSATTKPYDELEKKIKALEVELNQARSEWKSISEKKHISTKPSMSVMGRIMVDYSFLDADNALKTATGTSAKDGAEFRRARLGAKGNYKNVEYQIEYDFASGGATLKASYLRWRTSRNKVLWVGHIKEPFGLEFQSSSKYPIFIENSLLSAFYPSYNTGMYFTDDSQDKRLSYALGLFYDSGNFGTSSQDDEDDLNATGRLTYLFRNEGNGKKLLHFGLSHSVRNGNSYRFRTRAENHLWDQRFVDTGNIAAEGTRQTGLELVWHNGPLQVQAEHVMTEVNSIAGNDPDFNGTYIQASYFLTGEHRSYNQKYRLFSRVKPKLDYGLNGGRGAWQIAARYSTINLNDVQAGVSGGEQSSKTLGLNWHLNSHSRIMLNQTYSDIKGIGDASSTTLRFQIDF